jgi:uncharacterized protein with HEPN domain
MNRDQTLIRHILGAIDRVEQYTVDVQKENFIINFMIQDAVMRNIEIMGEASKYVSVEIRKKYAQIPWRDVTAMRNKLIHEYFGVDLEAVWNAVQLDLPVLKTQLLEILNSETD